MTEEDTTTKDMTPDEIADLRTRMIKTPQGYETVTPDIDVYEDLTPSQASDLYRWGSVCSLVTS